jgi:hypothetical protein
VAAARSHREDTSPLSKSTRKPATKASPKENAALLGRDQGKDRSEQPNVSAATEATIFAKPSWHDPDRVAKIALRFITVEAEDEAAVDRAIKLLDLIDRKTLAREKQRAKEIKEEANTPSHLNFRRGVVFITGRQRPDRAESLFIEYLLCWPVFLCPVEDREKEISRSLRGPNEEQVRYLERKKYEGFSKAELAYHRDVYRGTARFRSAVKKHRMMQKLSEFTPAQGEERPLKSEQPENS